MARLNKRGPRERSLYHALRKKYGAITSRLAVEVRGAAVPRANGWGCWRPVVLHSCVGCWLAL